MGVLKHITLKTRLAGIELKNPLVVASGIPALGLLKKCIDAGVGAVTTKTITPEPREGHPPPTVIDVGVGYINAVGLKNPGIEAFRNEMFELVRYAHERGAKVIGSAGASSLEGYVEVSAKLEEYGADIVELNVSCPTVTEVYSVGVDLRYLRKVVSEVKSVLKVPLAVKLSPDIRDVGKASKIVVDAGADIISLINTVSPATSIDIWTGRVRLGNPEGFGGLSGRAIKPVAVAKVMQAYASTGAPIIASGGVMSWEDVAEMIYAGGSAVAFLTALFRHKGTEFIGEMLEGLTKFMEAKGFTDIESMRGLSLKRIT